MALVDARAEIERHFDFKRDRSDLGLVTEKLADAVAIEIEG